MTLAAVVARLLGDDVPIRFEFYDGSALGPADAAARVVVERPQALARILYAPGELGVARAYVAGDLTVEGDLREVLTLRERMPVPRFTAADRLAILRALGREHLRPVAPPRRRSGYAVGCTGRGLEADAIGHHYDVSNEFYELLLGPAMTYTCALWSEPGVDLVRAQWLKHELVPELDYDPGMHLLDCGSGWGTMAISKEASTVRWSRRSRSRSSRSTGPARPVAEAGPPGVEVRYQDYRGDDDGPYDAISSIGMFEHVGSDLDAYPATMVRFAAVGRAVRAPRGQPSAVPAPAAGPADVPRPLACSPMPTSTRSARSCRRSRAPGSRPVTWRACRDHYPPTIAAWLANLDARWDEAVSLVGAGRARVWRLYLAAAELGMADDRIQIHQVVAVKPDHGRSGFSPVPGDWEAVPG